MLPLVKKFAITFGGKERRIMLETNTNSVPMFGSEISPHFQSAKNKDNLRGWLCRAYFAEKHKEEVYYNESVTPENVLEYITAFPKKFPQTPFAIANLWKILPGLQEDLKSLFSKEDVEEQAEAKNKLELAQLEKSQREDIVKEHSQAAGTDSSGTDEDEEDEDEI